MRYLTAGESHGPQLTAIIEGLPSQLQVTSEAINKQLARRQAGFGRGRRMQIEQDRAEIVGGVRHGRTTGAPVAMVILNRDWDNWKEIMNSDALLAFDDPTPNAGDEGLSAAMSAAPHGKRRIHRPRPGHADLTGGLKYGLRDLRDVPERSSARETAARVACGAVARELLAAFGIRIWSQTTRIGEVEAARPALTAEEIPRMAEASPVRTADSESAARMMAHIDEVKRQGDTIGGVIEVVAKGVPVGLGSHVHWDRKLDARIAGAVVSIQAFKGCEFGAGFAAGRLRGSQVHDEIRYDKERGFYRATNRAGGFEGGMTTGEPIVVRGVMKPIPTLYRPLGSVDIDSKQAFTAQVERSDACAVPAAGVVMEHVVAWEIACAFLDKFGGDSMEEIGSNLSSYLRRVREF